MTFRQMVLSTAALLGTLGHGTHCTALSNVVADSVAEFSGFQGQNNWFYGYYEGTLNPSGFQQMTVRRDGWQVDPDPPEPTYWTNITAIGGHPNGPLAGCCRTHVEHWAVRRYVSEVAGTVVLSGVLADLSGGNGDGIEGFIFVDGTEIFSAIIEDGDLGGISYSVSTSVNLGSIIDFAIAPRLNDFQDATRFTALVTLVPEPSGLVLLGLGCWSVALRRSCRR